MRCAAFGGAAFAAALLCPGIARADDAAAFAAGSASYGAVGLALVDVGFLAYDVSITGDSHAGRGGMIAQTIVFAPQAALAGVAFAYGQVDDEDSAAFTLGAMVPSVWMNAMTTFGAWTLASERLPAGERFGASWLFGSNVTFTTGAVTSLFRPDHLATPYLSIPEVVVQSAQAAGCFYGVGSDVQHRAQWLALGAWSTLLTAHGVVSVIGWAQSRDREPAAPPVSGASPRLPSWSLQAGAAPGGAGGPGLSMSGVF